MDNRRGMAKLTPHKINSTWSPKATPLAKRSPQIDTQKVKNGDKNTHNT
jgi:hypothetical protein